MPAQQRHLVFAHVQVVVQNTAGITAIRRVAPIETAADALADEIVDEGILPGRILGMGGSVPSAPFAYYDRIYRRELTKHTFPIRGSSCRKVGGTEARFHIYIRAIGMRT